MYNFAYLVGKPSLKSSHRMQSNAVLRGLDISLRKSDLDRISVRSRSARSSFLPKYLQSSSTFWRILPSPTEYHSNALLSFQTHVEMWKEQGNLEAGYFEGVLWTIIVCFGLLHPGHQALTKPWTGFSNKLYKVWFWYFIHFIGKRLRIDGFPNVRFDIITS